jgi:nitroreductase
MANFVPLKTYQEYPADEMQRRSIDFCAEMHRRRTIREYSDRPVAKEIIEQCIATAGSAPSGANIQPWHFVAVNDAHIKSEIRTAAEVEEREFYATKASEEWLKALEPLGTDDHKEFLEKAPWLIVVFAEKYGLTAAGKKVKHYYTPESVGLASGLLIAALHHAGLATLTHTPSPMGFLKTILKRPDNERPFLLIVAGYPEDDVKVPDISRKSLQEISTFIG